MHESRSRFWNYITLRALADFHLCIRSGIKKSHPPDAHECSIKTQGAEKKLLLLFDALV